jgi:hypothetical protein
MGKLDSKVAVVTGAGTGSDSRYVNGSELFADGGSAQI